VSILGTAKQMAGGVAKMMKPRPKPIISEPKNYLKETPEEYAERLMMRRGQRH